MVKRTNLPRRGTTKLVGGIISASRRKNTVNDRRIDMAKLTWNHHHHHVNRNKSRIRCEIDYRLGEWVRDFD
jgi:hypothetical protein